LQFRRAQARLAQAPLSINAPALESNRRTRTLDIPVTEENRMAEATARTQGLPERVHVYQNYALDSLRWDFVLLRDDDIVIATSYKAGTTWMQGLVGNLIFSGREMPSPLGQLSPWVDLRIAPLEVVLTELEKQTHRRFKKTHLPLDGLRYDEQVKYIYVGRDARDVFMSFWNHYRSFTEQAYARFNDTPGRVGPERPRCPDDIHEVWRNWMTRGWFDWETEGYPQWSNLRHAQTWWDYRDLPNILFVHYADLLADFEGEARRVADFLGIDVPTAAWPTIVRNCTLAEMRATAAGDNAFDAMFKEGANSFFYKGVNGRWRDILSEAELVLYDQAARRVLTPDCRQWLENGRLGSSLR
jgi:aryl sulfotransferase